MADLVFDVSYKTAPGCTFTMYGLSGCAAVAARRRHPGATVTPRKLLPCAQRRWDDARIATLPPAGTTPANPAGGGDL